MTQYRNTRGADPLHSLKFLANVVSFSVIVKKGNFYNARSTFIVTLITKNVTEKFEVYQFLLLSTSFNVEVLQSERM